MSQSHDTEQRYSRHLSLDGIGETGMAKLHSAKILLIGMGGLGCPAALYLASSGIGTLGLVDNDRVALSNLNRQILFETADIGRLKVEAASDALSELNPEISISSYPLKLNAAQGESLVAQYDLVIDGSDNVETRMLLNTLCFTLQKPLLTAAIHGWQGQLMLFESWKKNQPCYRCLFSMPPNESEMPKCSESGVFAPLAGMIGCWQAGEAIKYLTQENYQTGVLHRLDLRSNQLRDSRILTDDECMICQAQS